MVRDVKIDPSFPAFEAWCTKNKVPIVVVSR